MTHELKTPLANITLASEVLLNPDATLSRPKALHYASLVYKEAKRLEAQVSRVLEMARLEKGELSLQLNTVDVHALIREIASVVALPVEKRGGSLCMELQAPQSIVQADAHHLKNVLYNLLENAEKYSPQTPAITISTRNVGDQLVISVKDQGQGIGLERELIFEPFFRASNGNRHDTKGFGLGLSYVKKVVEAHQGHIQVNSQLQRGSQFEVFLRCA
jgi:two-component system phosphate regulon sensor histidine kinase PhoR